MAPRLTVATKFAAGFAGAVFVLAGCGGDGESRTDSKRTPGPAASEADPAGDAPPRVLDQNFPDPDVLKVGNTYYAYATQPSDNSMNLSVATSRNLTAWQVSSTDPLPKLPAWATAGRTWAPDVAAVGDTFVMYITARNTDPDLQCIGVAKASKPEGPFEPVGQKALICPVDQGGAIDAGSFVDTDGKRYLLWKNDGNCCGKDTWLYLQPMTPDGLRIAGPPKRLIKQTEGWEGNLVEAPTLVRRGSTYVLFYSANDYGGEKYATGYATAPKIDGPYKKGPEPLMTTDEIGVIGPGGQDVVELPGGKTRIVFHGWDAAIVSRGMYVADLTWDGNRPVVEP
jgi:beta-xylosidase